MALIGFMCSAFIAALPDPASVAPVELAADIGGTVKGRVLTIEGSPLHGAHIFIPLLGRGRATDDNGEFVFADVPAGKYSIVVRHIGYESATESVELGAGGIVEIDFKLKPNPIEQETVVITGSPRATNTQTTPQDITCVSGLMKLKTQRSSLGQTLESLPGIYNISAGPAAGKPVIRGLTGERVSIMSDGITQEYQQYGERHGPTIDAFSYDRIEVIKGASSLLYGSDALGGAVNLIPHPYHFGGDGTEIGGTISGGYCSNNDEYFLGFRSAAAMDRFAFRINLVRRNAGNFHTADAPSYGQTLERGDPEFTGEIPHTDFGQTNGSAGIGYLNHVGILAADYCHFMNRNNFLLPDGNPIGVQLENQIVSVKGVLPSGRFVIRPRFSYQRNSRLATRPGLSRDRLPDSADVNLKLNVLTARVEAENSDVFDLSGTIGTEVKYYDHENVGKVPLQPTGCYTSCALFGFEEWESQRLSIDFGLRFDYRTQMFYGTATNPLLGTDDRRHYSSVSGSIGAAFRLTDNLTVTAQAGRGFRSPSFFNLYVYGYHGGVFAFQIGNPDLRNESSIDVSSSVRFKSETLSTKVTLYRNVIYNYIFLYDAPNHPLAPPPNVAPFVFAHGQADAQLSGIDIGVTAAILGWLVLSGDCSLVRGGFTSGVNEGGGLPLMPPDRVVIGARVLLPEIGGVRSPYLSAEAKFVSAKGAAGAYEPFAQFDEAYGSEIPFGVCSTTAYSRVDAGLGFEFYAFGRSIGLDAEMTNLFDAAYRDFLDTYKGYALAPGRSMNVRVSVPFGVNEETTATAAGEG